jgi:ATP-dependent helicase/nuclease subunit B
MESPHSPITLLALERLAREHPFDRKLLIARRQGEGREVLRALTARGVSWLGFEVTTPWQLAQKLVAERLARRGLDVIDEFDQAALLDEAIDSVLTTAGGRLAELAEGPGLRRSIAGAVHALRLAGVDGAALARTRFRDEDKRVQLSRILTAYERLLDMRGSIDRAGVYRSAVASLALGEVKVAEQVYLLPGHTRRGLTGQLLEVLTEQGAVLLPVAEVHGLARPTSLFDAPTALDASQSAAESRLAWLHDVLNAPAADDPGFELFAATSLSAELREVLRRVLSAGLRWDEVEIVATDPLMYGVALDELSRRLHIPVSYAVGLPVTRTRPGRAVAKYIEWVRQDFPADVLRGMLERGDIVPPSGTMETSATAVARRLRRLKIAHGRDRYLSALDRAERALEVPDRADDERTPEERAAAEARERAEIAALRGLLEPLLRALPELPGRFNLAAARVRVSDLAAGVLALLAFVPQHTSLDRTAHSRLTQRLRRLASTTTRETTLDAALSALVNKLDDRLPAPDANGDAPWTSAGGHLHLSDLEHGGHAARAATFIVGLDAVRFPGSGLQDALLVDDDRRRLAEDAATSGLPTGAERVDERRYALAELLARMPGRVTLSYSTWDAVEGRAIPPAAELLQAYRLHSGNTAADYDAMHSALAPVASAVPGAASARLDSDDVWLAALRQGGILRYGVAAVRAAWPGLDAGFRAGHAKIGAALTPHLGLITPRRSHDPRVNPELVVSSTQLQTLGSCPHRYLLKYILRVRKPDDPDTSAEQWLSAMHRGSLLHAVYERTLRSFDDERNRIHATDFDDRAMSLLNEELATYRELLPPPGEAIFEAEVESLKEDVRAFIALLREDGARWIDVERKFGRDGADPVLVELQGSSIHMKGAIDRIDRLDDGTLVIIDYKTGSRIRYGGKSGDYDGGRRLQHVLYAAVAERLYGAEVSRAEFQFPSRKSENHRAVYRQPVLRNGLRVVDALLGLVEAGQFHPSNDVDDCRFCDYAAVCRVKVDDYGKVHSPLAEWSRESSDPVLHTLRDVRRG